MSGPFLGNVKNNEDCGGWRDAFSAVFLSEGIVLMIRFSIHALAV